MGSLATSVVTPAVSVTLLPSSFLKVHEGWALSVCWHALQWNDSVLVAASSLGYSRLALRRVSILLPSKSKSIPLGAETVVDLSVGRGATVLYGRARRRHGAVVNFKVDWRNAGSGTRKLLSVEEKSV